jgi:hypothetical protein
MFHFLELAGALDVLEGCSKCAVREFGNPWRKFQKLKLKKGMNQCSPKSTEVCWGFAWTVVPEQGAVNSFGNGLKPRSGDSFSFSTDPFDFHNFDLLRPQSK